VHGEVKAQIEEINESFRAEIKGLQLQMRLIRDKESHSQRLSIKLTRMMVELELLFTSIRRHFFMGDFDSVGELLNVHDN
jgi:ACT domain-containing protein